MASACGVCRVMSTSSSSIRELSMRRLKIYWLVVDTTSSPYVMRVRRSTDVRSGLMGQMPWSLKEQLYSELVGCTIGPAAQCQIALCTDQL